MPRIARVVVPDMPHHVTQRGSRRQTTFFTERDYRYYLALLRRWSSRSGVSVWAYCLMPNHVHLVAVPHSTDALARCIGEVHRRYSLWVNTQRDWSGHLWQDRFYSTVMDEMHAIAAARYVALNPVRAGLVSQAPDWPHSSARAHLGLHADPLVDAAAYAGLVADWTGLLASDAPESEVARLRSYTRTGRPLGDDAFVSTVEMVTGRTCLARARGRPRLVGRCTARGGEEAQGALADVE